MLTSILITNNNVMVVTEQEPIIQHSKLAHRVKFYVGETYMNELETKSATVMLEILAPNGKRMSQKLEAEDSSNKEGYLLYLYNLDAAYCTGAGEIQLGMSITYAHEDRTVVRTIEGASLTITPIQEWMVQPSDGSLTEIQQEIEKLTKLAKAIYDAEGNEGGDSGVTDLEVSENNLHLVNALGTKVGEGIVVADDNADLLDNISDAQIDLNKILGGNP